MDVDLLECLREGLSPPWNYGVTRDGRVFFINEESRSTTWLHPKRNHPLQSGHAFSQDLPQGWEKSVTPEGAPYYIDHLNLRTTFNHPITGETAAVQDYSPSNTPRSPTSPREVTELSRQNSKKKNKTKRTLGQMPNVKRNNQTSVSMKGWLYLQESSGLKSWKKRWFVLSEFCMFFYKGPEETHTKGSILLPSYKVNPCSREDNISKKFAFKAEHENMRTYYFAADTKEDMQRWMNVMSLATILQTDPSLEEKYKVGTNYYGGSIKSNDGSKGGASSGEQGYHHMYHPEQNNYGELPSGGVRDESGSSGQEHYNPEWQPASKKMLPAGPSSQHISERSFKVPENQDIPLRENTYNEPYNGRNTNQMFESYQHDREKVEVMDTDPSYFDSTDSRNIDPRYSFGEVTKAASLPTSQKTVDGSDQGLGWKSMQRDSQVGTSQSTPKHMIRSGSPGDTSYPHLANVTPGHSQPTLTGPIYENIGSGENLKVDIPVRSSLSSIPRNKTEEEQKNQNSYARNDMLLAMQTEQMPRTEQLYFQYPDISTDHQYHVQDVKESQQLESSGYEDKEHHRWEDSDLQQYPETYWAAKKNMGYQQDQTPLSTTPIPRRHVDLKTANQFEIHTKKKKVPTATLR